MTMTNGSRETSRAALYARVSTDQQAERYGLDAQRTLLRQRAAERGYTVVPDGSADIFADDESGGSFERPAWRRLELVLQQGGADVLVLLDPDRLSRDLTDMLNMVRRLQDLRVRLEFLTQEFEASPTGRAFFQPGSRNDRKSVVRWCPWEAGGRRGTAK